MKKKYDIVDLNKAGLTNSNYDVYKDRIMFPLFDINGKVVGFDSHTALAENCEVYREICESQEICIPGGTYCEV